MDQILGQDANIRCQLLLRLLEKKGIKGLEAVDAVLQENLLRTHRTLGVDAAVQTLPDLGGIVTKSESSTGLKSTPTTPLYGLQQQEQVLTHSPTSPQSFIAQGTAQKTGKAHVQLSTASQNRTLNISEDPEVYTSGSYVFFLKHLCF